MTTKAVTAGHSYIKRLKTSMDMSEDYQLNFGLNDITTIFHGISGVTTTRMMSEINNITKNKPHIVVHVLQVGGNDFTGNHNEGHRWTPKDIVTLAQAIVNKGVQLVFVASYSTATQ
jgi:hypothetical protein